MRVMNFFIKDKLTKLGKGSFQILMDDTHSEHKISNTVLEYIRKKYWLIPRIYI